jgi:hypothetical protein
VADEPLPPEPTPEARRRRVVALKKPAAPVSAEAVALLREALAQAEAGEISEVVMVYARHDGASGWNRTDVSFVSALLGELWMVGNELAAAAEEE